MLSSGNGVAPAIEAAGASEGGDYAAPPEEGVGPDALSLMQALQALPKVSCNNCFLIAPVQLNVSWFLCELAVDTLVSSCALVMLLYSRAQAHCVAFQNCGEAALIPTWLMREQRLPQISINCGCESSQCLLEP